MEDGSQGAGEERSKDRSDVCNSNESRHTQRKMEETLKQDLISAMPEAILLHILSFLPTKDAIKTSALSQRWLYLWTSVPNLDFSYFSESFRRVRRFVKFVDQTLTLHKCCSVKKFTVNFSYNRLFASRVDEWIRFATRANVEELCLNLNGPYDLVCSCFRHVLPQYVYTNSSITKLNLLQCQVVPSGLISWKSLKSLSIGYSVLSEDVIQKILMGSPVLEFLELYRFHGFYRLDIGSLSLRKLVVRDQWDSQVAGHDSVLEISAPNLQSLCISGTMNEKKFRLMDMQSLVDCNLTFDQCSCFLRGNIDYEVHGNVLRELLDRLHHVKKLTMGNWCIKVLSILVMKGVLSPLSKRRCLILNTPIQKCDVPGIAGLLQSSNFLETLVIDMTSFDSSEPWFNEDLIEYHWASQEWSSKCSLSCLKTLEIVGFTVRHLDLNMLTNLYSFYLRVQGC